MAITATPLWMEGLSTHASQDYRRLLEGLANYKPGIFKSADFVVSTNNNMTVTVGSGMALVDGSEDSNQGLYFVHADSNTVVNVNAAHATLNRYDMVVIRIRDDFYATGPTEGVDLFVVEGTPSGSPAEPTIPANSFVLARLTVTAADSSIASGDIVDRRTLTTNQGIVSLKGGFRLCTSSTRPTTNLQPYQDFIIESDTGYLKVWDGASWLTLSALNDVSVVTGSSTAMTTSFAAVTNTSISVPPGSWKIEAKGVAVQTGTAAQYDARIRNTTDNADIDTTIMFVAGPHRVPWSMFGTLENASTKTVRIEHMVGSLNATQTTDNAKLWITAVDNVT